MNGGGRGGFYVLPKSLCATTNKYFPIWDRHSGRICQHSLANIINVSQRFTNSLHQPTEQYALVGRFPNIQKGNKEASGSIDSFLHQLKKDVGEPIATRYVRDITGMTTIHDDYEKVFLPHLTLNHQYYAQWCFDHVSIVQNNI